MLPKSMTAVCAQFPDTTMSENGKFSVNPCFTNSKHRPKRKAKACTSFLWNSNVPLLL